MTAIDGYWALTYWGNEYWGSNYWGLWGTYVAPVVTPTIISGGITSRRRTAKKKPKPRFNRRVINLLKTYLEYKIENA